LRITNANNSDGILANNLDREKQNEEIVIVVVTAYVGSEFV
jgi:hypothetical protein